MSPILPLRCVAEAHERLWDDPNMIKRVGKNLAVLDPEQSTVTEASAQLERDGYAVLRGVLTSDEVVALTEEIEQAFATRDPERGRSDRDEFRYEMLNHGPRSQAAVATPEILSVIEPLLGDDCHVIANTAWCNPPEVGGGPWHCDAGPHVPRPRVSSGTTGSRIPCSRSAPTCC
jgi:ectoine hydroxylase-related dioxygenase (phytanoyl-CoA dioxygenase family)